MMSLYFFMHVLSMGYEFYIAALMESLKGIVVRTIYLLLMIINESNFAFSFHSFITLISFATLQFLTEKRLFLYF